MSSRIPPQLRQLRPYLHICHLHRPIDLLLLLLPALWTLSLSPGTIDYGAMAVLLLAATAVRCAAWVYNDLLDSQLLPEAPESFTALGLVDRREAWILFAGLLSFALLLVLILGWRVIPWAAVALVLLLGYPHIKRRTLLTQAYMGLCFAWIVAISQATVPELAAKSVWLLFTATLLWATACTTLYAMPRQAYEERVGIGSLLYLFGENSSIFILVLQVVAVISLWFIGNQAGLGTAFSVALLGALAQLVYQQWLLANHPGTGATRAYRSNILFGLIILLGFIAERS